MYTPWLPGGKNKRGLSLTMKKSIIITVLSGGVVGGVFSAIVLAKFLQHIGEYNIISTVYLTILGLLTGIFIVCTYLITNYLRRWIETKTKKIATLYAIPIFSFFIFGTFLGLYLLGENNFFSWLFLALAFSILIYLGFDIFSGFTKNTIIRYFLNIIGGGMGGAIAGIFVSLAFSLRINSSIAEGYFLLIVFLLSLIGAVMGIVITISVILYQIIFKETLVFSRDLMPKKAKVISVLLVFALLLSMTACNYWGIQGLNESAPDTDNANLFTCYSLTDKTTVSNTSGCTKKDIINFFKLRTNKTHYIDLYATLYLLSGEEQWANEFKQSLLEEAREDKFINESGSIKGWQFGAMTRAYYYLLLNEMDSDLFNKSEKDLVLTWFKKLNENVFELIPVDYVYAVTFRKMPDGLYANQEMGTGMLSVLSEILKEEYPELSKKDKEYINKLGIGWRGNFRNPDDGIIYHQHVWIKNAYVMAKYGGHEKYLLNNNTRNSFEWLLLQWPPNGMCPAYNFYGDYTPFDIMVLGAHLFDDGRYLWLAEKMLEDEMGNINRKLDYLLGLEVWNDDIVSVEPTVGSCYIKGTTGIAQKLGPIEPDKIVFRDGWNCDSLYALLNLRFSGWHSYKATNSFVTIMYGEPFVVEKLDLKWHSWLPEGRADHRDKKIDRTDLNGFQMEKTGLSDIIYGITGIGSSWAQDPPRFAEVLLFNSTYAADFSKTLIQNWHGWTQDRVSILVKDEDYPFFIIFDHAKGNKNQKVAITWHLKGDAELKNQSIKLHLGDYSLAVHYPHQTDWYETKIYKSNLSYPAGYIHDPDIDLWMISKDKSEVGFITIFYPVIDDSSYKVENIDVLNSKSQSAYSKAMGIKIITPKQTDIIGARFNSGEFIYENIKTDAEIFIMQKDTNSWTISFENAESFEMKSNKPPISIKIGGKALAEDSDWRYYNNTICINLKKEHLGHLIDIYFRENWK